MSVVRTRREALKWGLAAASLVPAALAVVPRVTLAKAASRVSPASLRYQALSDRLGVVSGARLQRHGAAGRRGSAAGGRR